MYKLLINKCYVATNNKKQLFENESKKYIRRIIIRKRWTIYYRQWIVIKSLDHLIDRNTSSVIASFC